MDDLISRQAAIDACLNGKCANVYDCADAIKALLSVDLDKVKQEFKQDVRAQMSSADLISRQAVIESIKRNAYRHTYLDQIIDIIKDFPSAQPERETGEWIPVTNGRGGFECSKCHDYAPSYKNGDDHLSRYCPNCGAEMKGEGNADNSQI